jgi:enoyl-CoA hydratase
MTLVRFDQRDGTAVVTLCRPPANAIDLSLLDELNAHLARLEADVPPHGLVITGEGRAFSGGVDFKAVPRYDADEKRRLVVGINAMVTRLYGLATATVAAVNGHAIGGAFVILLACDARLAVKAHVKLGLTEVTAGIPYPACPMEVVRAELEPSWRRRIVLSGETFDPTTAHAHGVIDELVAPDALLSRAIELARARAAAPAYAAVKRQLKADVLERMRAIVANESDPMLRSWS